jgi:hypothetical protein
VYEKKKKKKKEKKRVLLFDVEASTSDYGTRGGGNVSWPCLVRPIGVEEGLDRTQLSVIPATRARVLPFDVEVGAGGVSNARTEAEV